MGVGRRALPIGEGGLCCQEQTLTARKLIELFTHQVEGRKQCRRRDSPGGEDIGGPGDETAEQLVIIGVEAGYEKVHNVGDVFGSAFTLSLGVVAHCRDAAFQRGEVSLTSCVAV